MNEGSNVAGSSQALADHTAFVISPVAESRRYSLSENSPPSPQNSPET